MEPAVATSLSIDSDAGTNASPHSQHYSEIASHDSEPATDFFDRLLSTDLDHIGVGENPPLCRNCKEALCKPQVLGEVTDIAGMVERVKASAFLGCYLCSVMYNGDWMPLGSTDPSRGGKLSDLEPPPDLFECSLFQIGDQKEKGSLHIRVTAVTFPEGTEKERHWYLPIIPLFPEDSKEVAEILSKLSPTLSAKNTIDSVTPQFLSWIEECQSSHLDCKESVTPSAWRPTRLIFTGRPELGLKPRLCLTSFLGDAMNARYVTLSHCWGSLDIFRLLSTNLEALRQELPLDKLTQVFRDAIDLARRVGVSFIWIDSLCIIQDSPEDWEQESAVMGQVYLNSWCNIAATGFKDGRAGMYVERDPKILKPIVLEIQARGEKVGISTEVLQGRFYCMENPWSLDVENAPLNHRGWVYQERVLSPRILHLSSRQVFWECSTSEACEAFPSGLPGTFRSQFKFLMDLLLITKRIAVLASRAPEDKQREFAEILEQQEKEVFHTWWRVVKGYNRGQLTKFEDKLIAFSGVAQEVQVCFNDTYVAGLWAKHLIQHLTWSVVPSHSHGYESWEQWTRPQFYQAPSWSWASINREVYCFSTVDSRPLATVVDYKVTVTGPSKFGPVTDGYIRLSGRIFKATFPANDDELRQNSGFSHELVLQTRPSSSDSVVVTLLMDVRVAKDNDPASNIYLDRDAVGSRDFYMLPTCDTGHRWAGLVLQRTESEARGQYRRLGAFWQTKEKDELSFPFESRIPFLVTEDYEHHDESGYTISII